MDAVCLAEANFSDNWSIFLIVLFLFYKLRDEHRNDLVFDAVLEAVCFTVLSYEVEEPRLERRVYFHHRNIIQHQLIRLLPGENVSPNI